MKSRLFAAASALLCATPAAAQMAITPMGPLRPDQQKFFELYKELVETDTSPTTGNCTTAAAQVAARMKAAGFADDQLTQFSLPEFPKDGGLVAVLPGTSKTLKPMLLLAHIDVVVAKREDWERDPYKLVEENGYYYARGIADDKFQSAVYADTLIRLKQEGFKPQRTIKLALTCGEETDTAWNGAEWLAKERRDLIDAEFSDTTRVFFQKAGAMRQDETGRAMVALSKDLNDASAMAVVNRDKALHSMLRTTCVATMIQGGHAVNALPQKVEANVNCRIFPGHSREEIRNEIARIIGNDTIAIRYGRDDKPVAKPPALDPRLIGPMEKLAARYFPGVPVIPAMSTGATDAVYTGGAGIPTYGVPSAWSDPDGNGTHGLNERLEIKGVYTGRDYLFDLVKTLANTK
jgi:acetylornithine deacetylase/succinyl-diaminopimelate desuccinylase-like protein